MMAFYSRRAWAEESYQTGAKGQSGHAKPGRAKIARLRKSDYGAEIQSDGERLAQPIVIGRKSHGATTGEVGGVGWTGGKARK